MCSAAVGLTRDNWHTRLGAYGYLSARLYLSLMRHLHNSVASSSFPCSLAQTVIVANMRRTSFFVSVTGVARGIGRSLR